jgi:hypothetical protein
MAWSYLSEIPFSILNIRLAPTPANAKFEPCFESKGLSTSPQRWCAAQVSRGASVPRSGRQSPNCRCLRDATKHRPLSQVTKFEYHALWISSRYDIRWRKSECNRLGPRRGVLPARGGARSFLDRGPRTRLPALRYRTVHQSGARIPKQIEGLSWRVPRLGTVFLGTSLVLTLTT